MKLQKLIPYLFALLLVTTLSGCKKDDDKGPSKKDLLTAGEWRGFDIFFNGIPVTSELQNHEEFPFDITKYSLRFDKSGTYLVTYDGFTDNGTWEFTNNEQSLLLNKSTSHQTTVKINELSATEFYYVESIDNTGKNEAEYRFRR